jgi:hypothetical protein
VLLISGDVEHFPLNKGSPITFIVSQDREDVLIIPLSHGKNTATLPQALTALTIYEKTCMMRLILPCIREHNPQALYANYPSGLPVVTLAIKNKKLGMASLLRDEQFGVPISDGKNRILSLVLNLPSDYLTNS